MSTFQAIGGVSRSLQTLLRDRMEIPPLPSTVTAVPVTVGTPAEDDDTTSPRINLFLFRVSENEYLKNQEIPGRGHPAAYGRPPLSLDLHYLITAYGSSSEGDGGLTNETLAHYLLGSAMRVLHDFPVITEAMETGDGLPILDPSLHDEFERVKLTLNPLSLEDMTEIWTALTLSYRLSVAYAVSVVQIESQAARRYPRPVGELPEAGPRVTVVTLNTPRIDRFRVRRQEAPAEESPVPYARIGDGLVVLGGGFVRGETVARVGTVAVPPLADPAVTDERLEIVIPDDPELQPGAQPLKVIRQIELGEPPEPRSGFHSNLAVLMLVPRVTGAGHDGTTVTVAGSRLYLEGHDGQAIVGDQVVGASEYTSASPASISFPLPALDPGTYVVRVRVNGAESIDSETITVP
jgi:hypothetical protein